MPKQRKSAARTELQKEIGERMLWARELVEPNRTEVARWLRVDPSTLTKVEEGKRAASIFLVVQYANRFKVTTDYILRGQLLGRMDEEMRVKLAARHPELVLSPNNTDWDTDTDQCDGKHCSPTTQAPVH